jgi:hypothetical protein
MAVGVDEARQQNDFAEVADFSGGVRLQIRPRTYGTDPIFRNDDGTVFDGWPGNRQNRSGAKNHWNVAGDKCGAIGKFRGDIPPTETRRWRLNILVLSALLGAGGDLVLGRLAFAVPFADLLLDFSDAVNGRIQIAFDILGKKIRPAHAQADRATELFLGHAGVVMFEGHACVHGAPVKMVELLQTVKNAVLDGLGQRHIVCRKNQFHVSKMQPAGGEIQFFLGFFQMQR